MGATHEAARPLCRSRLPCLRLAAGERASYRLFEIFAAQTRNPNTRRAYMRAVDEFVFR
ncbi:MAG: hypothetical protein M3Z96_12690 [Pseudomonadota bacterium]|nr:hypothetical protein [Pseudomonadota bacterium]